jgi:alpha-tubulin suppressor-like RCC1 family protein
LSIGQRHTCALRATGAIVCWGSDIDGQLGTGTAAYVAPTHIELP